MFGDAINCVNFPDVSVAFLPRNVAIFKPIRWTTLDWLREGDEKRNELTIRKKKFWLFPEFWQICNLSQQRKQRPDYLRLLTLPPAPVVKHCFLLQKLYWISKLL